MISARGTRPDGPNDHLRRRRRAHKSWHRGAWLSRRSRTKPPNETCQRRKTELIDYHVHLWRHGPQASLQATIDQRAAYCAHASDLGVTESAVTEHCSRFGQFDTLVRGWWDNDPSPARRAEMSNCWDEELGADLDQYVETALAAKAAGLPLVVGMEVDYFPGQMDKVAALLRGTPSTCFSAARTGSGPGSSTPWSGRRPKSNGRARGVEGVGMRTPGRSRS